MVLVFGVGMDVDGVAIASVIGKPRPGGLCLDRSAPLGFSWRPVVLLILNWSLPVHDGGQSALHPTVCLLLGTALLKAKSAEFGDVTLAANAILFSFGDRGLAGRVCAFRRVSSVAIGQDPVALSRLVRASTVCAFAVAVLFAVFWLLGDDLIALMTGIESVRNEAALPRLGHFPSDPLGLPSSWTASLSGPLVGGCATQ